MVRRIRSALGLALTLAVCLPAALVHADSGTGRPVVLRPCDAQGKTLDGPGYWVISASPGEIVHLTALIGNQSATPARISVIPVDATSGVYGGISMNLPTQRRAMVGAWIHLPTERVALDAERANILPFTVHVPAHTKPGQYIGGVTAFVPAKTTRHGNGFAFTVQTRLADAVVVTVPGPQTYRLGATGMTVHRRPSGAFAMVHIANSGNMLLKGAGHLYVWRLGTRRPVMSVPLAVDTTVPGTTVHYPIRVPGYLHRARYTYRVSIWWNGGSSQAHGAFRLR